MRLTKTVVAKLEAPPDKSELTYYDDDLKGFGVRARRGGKKSWVAVYRIGRKVRRVTIGDATIVGPDEARSRAREVLAKADLGEDTQARRTEEKTKAAATLGAVIDLYIRQYVEKRQRPKTQYETKRYLSTSWRPLHEVPIHRITRRDIAIHLSDVVENNGAIAANRARTALHGFFVWAMQQGIADSNPVAGTAAPANEQKRDRVLTNDEIRAIWTATIGSGDYATIVRLLMLTGQRREEVAGMRWQELDFDQAIWSLPADRTKNGQAHDVPLSRDVLSILRQRERRGDRQLLFGEGKGSYSGWSQAKARLDRRSGVVGWRIHDIRRTVVTGMAELGVQPHIIEATVNHLSGHKAGVAGIYNRATYATEKRHAMRLWADHIAAIVNDDRDD